MEDDQTNTSADESAASTDISGRMARLGYGAEAIALLGIARLHGVGFQTLTRLGGRDTIRRLLDQRDLGVFEQAISAAGGRVPAGSPASGWDGVRRLIWSQGVEQARTLAERGASFIFDDDPKFPRSLSDLPPASRPRWLYYRGNIGLLERPCLTVVGTRDPSPNGEFLARYAVSCAREFDAPVISGLARGVDRVVHEWCLQIGLPTISVMATGILTLYPARHADLGDQIVQAGGLLVSEYLPDQGPTAENFVWRNRLQAALGRAVIPAEWARKSGTAHTVRFARDLRRPVISLGLSGIRQPADAGMGDHHFGLPGEHAGFFDTLRQVMVVSADRWGKPNQLELFGSGQQCP